MANVDRPPDGGVAPSDGSCPPNSKFAPGALLISNPCVAVAAFGEEEGARFGVACLGSRLLTGAIAPEAARGLRDASGVTLAAAMAAAGHDPGLDPSK